MHPAPAPVSARTAVLLAAVVVLPSVTGLSACSLIGDSCHGTTAAKAQLAAQPILSAAPHGAAEPANYHGEGTTTGCDDDSPGKAWLHADRVYAYTGTPGDVIGYYEKTAPAVELAAGGPRARRAARRGAGGLLDQGRERPPSAAQRGLPRQRLHSPARDRHRPGLRSVGRLEQGRHPGPVLAISAPAPTLVRGRFER